MRGTMTVPTTLATVLSTSSAPAAAATSRTAIGAVISYPWLFFGEVVLGQPGSVLGCCAAAIRPNVVDVVDREVDEALARSFLAELPAELAGRLRSEGGRDDYPAGTTVYRAGDDPRAALVVRGLIRVFLSSPGGRQVTVRYARPGDVLGIAVLVGGPAGTSVQAVEPSSVFRISGRTLTAAAQSDARVAWAIAEELNRRLYEVLEQTAVNAFGSVRQRVAAHLLDLASGRQRPGGRLVARVSQQELADAAGSVREVVARARGGVGVGGVVGGGGGGVVVVDGGRVCAGSGGPAGLWLKSPGA